MIPVSMDTATTMLRISFLVGAVTDGLAIIPMVFPRIGSALFGGDSSRLGAEYRYAMGIGASLMAGWTALLVWGAMNPIERRDVLILTLVPVVAGIIAATVIAVRNRLVLLSRVIPLWIHLGFMSILFVVSYVLSFYVAN
ncbi:MAG: hypothetical protein MUP26_06630 [Desulfobulbaceae bacterium]|nr:hypothetical protein [Desulfobulbaceae bacterium]